MKRAGFPVRWLLPMVGAWVLLTAAMPTAHGQQPRSSVPAAPSASQLLGGKLAPYVGCMNRHSGRIHESAARYKSWVGARGPTGRERVIYGVYEMGESAPCRLALTNAAAAQPSRPGLEKAGADYAAALAEIEPLIGDAHRYYEERNYRDDAMARGKSLHPRLLAAWERFATADRALRDIVHDLTDEVQAAQLGDIERAFGRRLRWHSNNVMIRARALHRLECCDEGKLDVAKVAPALEAFEAALRDMETYADRVKAERPSADRVPGEVLGTLFRKAARDYLITAKELMRRKRDRVPYSQGDRLMLGTQGAGWMVQGSPPRLIRDYNQLIDRFNNGIEQ